MSEAANRPLTEGEQFLFLLEKLRKRLNSSGVERTVGLKERLGLDCDYYKKSLAYFLKLDYREVTDLLKSTYESMLRVENDQEKE